MYQAYGLIEPKSPIDLGELQPRLRAKFPEAKVTSNGSQITISQGDWEFELRMNSEPTVLVESADFAEKIAGQVDGAYIAACDRRIEVWSETPDPMIEHFNDFLSVIEVLKSFEGVIAIDPREPSLM